MEEEHSDHVLRSQSRDEGRLAELGYKQELKREWTLIHNFGVSFSIIVRVQAHLRYSLSRFSSQDILQEL